MLNVGIATVERAKTVLTHGRNRFMACKQAGVEPRFQEWNGDGSLIDRILSLNLHRRHLTESQRGMVAARVANLEEGRPEKTRSIDRVSSEQAAKMLGIGIATVGRAKAILTHGIPELIQAVDEGKITVTCHTQEDIAKACGIDQQRVSELLPDSENFPLPVKYLFQDDFDPPIYNVWKQQAKPPDPVHPLCIPTRKPSPLNAFPALPLQGQNSASAGPAWMDDQRDGQGPEVLPGGANSKPRFPVWPAGRAHCEPDPDRECDR